MRFKLMLILCMSFTTVVSIDQSLLMFVHANSDTLGDEEGLNVAYQALTAIMQKAAPVLMSEVIWQHVVIRKNRFAQGLQRLNSVQQHIMDLHHNTNMVIKKHKGQVDVVNRLLNDDWYKQEHKQLSELDQQVLKHHFFDFFCFYIFNYLDPWNIYRLPQGYLLWLPHNQSSAGFCLQHNIAIHHSMLSQLAFENKSSDLDQVIQKYLYNNKSVQWTFYLTGHGYHKDAQHPQAGVAGMNLPAFRKLLLCLNNHCATKLLIYSSCYGAGQHSILPYQHDDKDLLLSYPVIMISLTDAPSYVFGVPAGLKLPPYDSQNFLVQRDVGDRGLKTYFLQKFRHFCKQSQAGINDISLARLVNPNTESNSIIKVENIPLIRKAGSSYFMPLDQSALHCLVTSQDADIDLTNKAACLLYVNHYPGKIKVSSKLSAFVSMIPGGQVHHIGTLQAQGVEFGQLIRSLFLSIDDLYDQNIYLFDTLVCDLNTLALTASSSQQLTQVLVLPTGPWLPSFAQDKGSCYVYFDYNNESYTVSFDQQKSMSPIQKLTEEQKLILQQFKQLLLQESALGSHENVKTKLSGDYFKQRTVLQKQLLEECVQRKICK